VVFKTKVLHFKVENTPIKDTNGKEKFKRMFGLFFVDKRKICASLTAKRLARFETTKAANFLKKFQVHSVLYGQGKYVFKGFMQVFYILTLV